MALKDFTDKRIAELERRLTRALSAIVIFGVGEAAERAPVDTGNLRNSFTGVVGARRVIGPGAIGAGSHPFEAVVGTAVGYAERVEIKSSRPGYLAAAAGATRRYATRTLQRALEGF